MIPELPDIGLTDYVGTNWLKSYVEYATAKSPMTPTLFHESAGLWLLSVVIARRVVLHVSWVKDGLYPNLFICWLAPTTRWAKSTGLSIAEEIIGSDFSHLLAPQNMTPEAFLSDMAGREPTNFDQMNNAEKDEWRKERDFCSQRGLILDEMSGMMAACGRDYNAGLMEDFLKFYDCKREDKRSTRGQGRIIVHDSYLTMISASTPSAMRTYLQSDLLWTNGWWPRFALITPDSNSKWIKSEDIEEPPIIGRKLHFIYNMLPQHRWPDKPKALQVLIEKDAFDLWWKYTETIHNMVDDTLDDKIAGTYGRSQTQALKVAMLLATSEFDGAKIAITKIHVNDGILIAESWRKSAHRVFDMTNDTDFNKIEARIVALCANGASLRDLYTEIRNHTPTEIQDVLIQLEKTEQVERFYDTHGGKPGRPTTKYKVCKR